MEKKPCGLPPKFPVNSALRAKDVIIEVPDSAVFKCREIGKVTDLGKSIDIQVQAILLTYFVRHFLCLRAFLCQVLNFMLRFQCIVSITLSIQLFGFWMQMKVLGDEKSMILNHPNYILHNWYSYDVYFLLGR